MGRKGIGAVTLSLLLAGGLAVADPKTVVPPAGADSTRREAVREGWPGTRAGELAYRWVKAFSQGEHAMKACLADIMAPDALAKKGIPARVERYRDLRERFGVLTLVSVDKSAPGQVEATLAASDLSQHHFIFYVQAEAPYKMVSVAMRESGHMGIPGFGH